MKNYFMITGATGGLGRAFAVECASRGWNLFLTDLQPDRLEVLAKSLQNTYGVEARWQPCDLTDESQRAGLFSGLAAGGERFNGLINVAGGDVEGLFGEQRTEHIRLILRLNIEAAVEMTHRLLDLRDEAAVFHVVNVASLAAFYPMPYKATYAASKRFLLDFSLALREELRGQRVTMTAVCPAGMPTTPECIAAIEAQGLMGQLTTLNTGSVAAGTLDAALQGRAVYIPGTVNRMLRALGALAPSALVVRLVGRRWASARETRINCQPVGALAELGLTPDVSFPIPATPFAAAKWHAE